MIKKQHLKSRPVCKLTFELDPQYEADQLQLVASFNAWQPLPFDKLKNGKWKLQVEVEPGESFEFRYRGQTGEEVWFDNDPTADELVWNEYGSQNAVVHC